MELRKGSQWKMVGYDGTEYISSDQYDEADICPFGFITKDKVLGCGFRPLAGGQKIKPQYGEIRFTNEQVAIVIYLNNQKEVY